MYSKSNIKTWMVVWVFLLGMAGRSLAGRIITVDDDGPADFNTIQAAIDDANDGDIVEVRPGVYEEDINFLGKNITLTSTNPTDHSVIALTTIGYNDGYLIFRGIEEPNCALIGFAINSRIVGFDWSIDPNGENHTHATINNCILQGNRETCGTVIEACDGLITNCLIADNNLCICACICPSIVACHGLVKNCTIANFTWGVGIEVVDDGITTVQNCIIYGRHQSKWPQIMVGKQATLNISYCYLQDDLNDVEGTVNWGPGNIIDSDPCFVRFGYWEYNEPNFIFYEGDYHLKSQAGRWDPNSQSWVQDEVTSPCIDAGNPADPIEQEPFPNGGIINMGAYGGTAQASKSYFGKPPCEIIIAGDINGDCEVNSKDFALMAMHWLECAGSGGE